MNKIAYAQDFARVLTHIQQARQKAYAQSTPHLLSCIGTLAASSVKRWASKAWGKSVVSELAQFIANNDPTAKGFSDKNLWRMKQLYETYQGNQKLSAVLRELHPRIDNTFKDNYVLEFLGLPQTHSETHLQAALSRTLSPTLIAQYQTQLPDKKLIQAKLHELYTLSIEAQEMQS
ncbi:MAG: DUF1016 N-terminal domain-containing protein [Methylobacter sp.]|nr:DUF1016 N-terminal domain-containing protein [Methylobacter sp.]